MAAKIPGTPDRPSRRPKVSFFATMDEATSERLSALAKRKNCSKAEVFRLAVERAAQSEKEADDAPALERLTRLILKVQEGQISIQDRLREVEEKITDSRRHSADRFDQVIAFIRESEKAFGPLREDLANVNKNALVAALYAMAIGVHSPKAAEINSWIQARNQGA